MYAVINLNTNEFFPETDSLDEAVSKHHSLGGVSEDWTVLNVDHFHEVGMLRKIRLELKRRTDLIEDRKFRVHCAREARKLGITPKQWMDDKVTILGLFANMYCAAENELNLENTWNPDKLVPSEK